MADFDIKFENYSIQCKKAINDRINIALEECAGELESQVKRNSRVAKKNGGKTKNSFRHHLDKIQHIAYIGSPEQNAVWEEFGTGEYALKGNGRKGGWSYKDAEGNWHYTKGKTPSRAFWKAYTKLKNKIIRHLQNSMKGL